MMLESYLVYVLCTYTFNTANMHIISTVIIDRKLEANIENFRLVYFEHLAPIPYFFTSRQYALSKHILTSPQNFVTRANGNSPRQLDVLLSFKSPRG